MSCAPSSPKPQRGTGLLLAHCRELERRLAVASQPPQERLEGLLGTRLTAVLVRGLAADYRPRPALDLR